MKHLSLVGSIAITVLAAAVSAQGADWGSLTGKFVYDGDVKPRVKITPTKDVETCGKHDLFEETVWADSNGGLANVLVYLYLRRGAKVDVHPDYDKTAEAEIVLDNKGCRFEPHVCLLRTSQTLVIKNSDPVGHNTNCQLRGAPFNEIIAAGKEAKKTIKKPESIPAQVGCNIHPWMRGYLVVRDDPYMTISAEDGTFEIKNLPAGKHEIGFWHEASGNLRDLKVGKGKTSRRGRIELTIRAGDTLDLGEIKIPPKLLDVK